MPHCNDTVCRKTTRYDDNERICACRCSTCEVKVARVAAPMTEAQRAALDRAAGSDRDRDDEREPERDAPAPSRRHAQPAGTPTSAMGNLLVLAVLAGGGFLLYRSCEASWAESKAEAAKSGYGRKVGDRVRLYMKNAPTEEVVAISDPQVFERFRKIVMVDDPVVRQEIAPRIWYVAPKTDAEILEVVEGGFRVRFTSGPRTGERAHVHWTAVQDPAL